MSKGLRFIRLSEASSPTDASQGFSQCWTGAFSPLLSVFYFLTRAVQAASQLGGHHLHDEAYPEPQHVAKDGRLRAHVHGEIHHDLLREQEADGRQSEKSVNEGGTFRNYLR